MLGGDRSTRTDGYDGCSQSENRTRRSPSAGADTPLGPSRHTRSAAHEVTPQGPCPQHCQEPGRRAWLWKRCSQPSTTGPLAGSGQHPHHVKLVQAQPVDAWPLTVHGLPEGLKEQVL